MRWLAPIVLIWCGTTAAWANESWREDLRPIAASDWNRAAAAHLLERAGFGATPEELDTYTSLGAGGAVRRLVYPAAVATELAPFDHSDIHDPGIEPFPVSRPATTDMARRDGAALGVKVKPNGNRPMQPVVNKFFYWLRASRLETHRLAYWWANRMLNTPRPLEEKLALFWHGHFATNEEKVRDYRKMLQQLEIFQRQGLGNFRELLLDVARGPAMLSFLDAGVNVKGAPNENFAREIMELFTMGVGNYSERDIREAARAFTGWNFHDLNFQFNDADHDAGDKSVLGHSGAFDGEAVVDIILAQPVTAEYIAAKLYRYFVREELSPELRQRLGAILRENNYAIAPFLETVLLSRDFYSSASVGTRIKSPVDLVVSTYRKLGLKDVPGVPDFNEITAALGQQLFRPPTVAGWAHGRSWITPGLLLERGNFARDVVFPDITALPSDRYPVYPSGDEIRSVHERISIGLDISSATQPVGRGIGEGGGGMAMSNMMADRDEDFNTRFASYRGWQMAVEKVKPIPRNFARLDLTTMVFGAGCRSSADAVDHLLQRFLSVPVEAQARQKLIDFLSSELGTDDLAAAQSFAEDPLRMTLHLILSMPEYQLG
jgi:uncharacterized protein (DUF1800 family)